MKKWIKYWRNSLIDYSRMSIDVKDIENQAVEIEFNEIASGFKEEYIKELLNKKEDSTLIMVTPFIVKRKTTHGLKKQSKYCPFWIPLTLYRDGKLTPPSATSLYPWFIREVISPNMADETPNITESERIDKILDKYDFKECDDINSYLDIALQFFKEVTGVDFYEFKEENFVTQNRAFAIKCNNSINMLKSLIEGYDYLLDSDYATSLIRRVAKGDSESLKKIKNEKDLYLEGHHIGQMSSEFPLSKTQRSSCSLYFNKKDCGEILAVNGPPGTGKTTLLQTVLANTIVEPVLYGKEQMPLTIATSTNNQAITNILDSFYGVGCDRWLPEINSLGLYFVSSSSEKGAIDMGRPYINRMGDGTFTEIETEEYYLNAKKHFLEQYNKEFKSTEKSLSNCITSLRKKVQFNTFRQKDIIKSNKEYLAVESPDKEYLEIKNKIVKASDRRDFFKSIQKEFEDYYKNISIIDKVLPFTKSAKFKREWFNRKVFKEVDISNIDITDSKELNTLLVNQIKNYKSLISSLEIKLDKIKEASEAKNRVVKTYLDLKKKLDIESEEKVSKLYKITGDEYSDVEEYEDINIKLDITSRAEAYKWAIHYWEALYLKDLKKYLDSDNKKEFGFKEYKKKLQRWAKVFPCFISTTHTLPSIAFQYGWSKPFFGLFDQIIFDEAGQVCAEVGALSFAYAKRAIVVGDTKQIEPIWTINRHVDIGNLQMLDIIKSEDDYHSLEETGLLASSGSIMRLAQNASCYKDGLDRGYSLKEHRRCLDEIVLYCEKFVYRGALIPKVGPKTEKCIKEFPSMGYLNIEGKKERKFGSNCNQIEATYISNWILDNRDLIENHYNKNIGKVLAVVTPFSAQKKIINIELKKLGLGNEGITVGTVHALQGAERNIILFSPVYSDPKEGFFFDSNYNMLNVAVSRAKHNFFVFGKIKIFNPGLSTPSGDLAKVLFSDKENELGQFHISKSLKLNNSEAFTKNRISELDKHRRVLNRAIYTAKNRLVIVSPFISIKAIEDDSLIEHLKNIIEEGVDVTVFTDQNLDSPTGKLKNNSKLGREALTNIGVELKIIQGIHQKSILVDDDILIEGSFNWLSAVRDETSPYFRQEVSYIITKDVDSKLEDYIKDFEKELDIKSFVVA